MRTSSSAIPQESRRKKNSKQFLSFRNIALILGFILIVGLLMRAELGRRQANSQIKHAEQELSSIGNETDSSDDEVTDRVLRSVGKLIRLPDNPKPAVGTIVDVETLRTENEFYEAAKNGDHVVVTDKRVILYDPRAGIIIDVLPVQGATNDDRV